MNLDRGYSLDEKQRKAKTTGGAGTYFVAVIKTVLGEPGRGASGELVDLIDALACTHHGEIMARHMPIEAELYPRGLRCLATQTRKRSAYGQVLPKQ
jgi:hypothetical protein